MMKHKELAPGPGLSNAGLILAQVLELERHINRQRELKMSGARTNNSPQD